MPTCCWATSTPTRRWRAAGRSTPRGPHEGAGARQAAERAVGRLASELGLSTEDTAAGIVRVSGSAMAQAVRMVTVERGIDPRGLALVAFGGAGPLHAAAITEELGMERVVAPVAAGVLSALGLAVSERRRDVVESVLLSQDKLTREAVAAVVERLGGLG